MEENPARSVFFPRSFPEHRRGRQHQPPSVARPAIGHEHPMINLLPRADSTLQLSLAKIPHWLELSVVANYILCILGES